MQRQLQDRSIVSLVDATMASAAVLVFTKVVGAWLLVAAWGVPLRSRFLLGFIPYAGLATTGQQFRQVAQTSTLIVGVVAIVWALWHFLRRRRHPQGYVWGGAAVLLMAPLLAVAEWWRRFDADHLLATNTMIWIVLVFAAAVVLFLGFIEYPNELIGPKNESVEPASQAEVVEITSASSAVLPLIVPPKQNKKGAS